MCALSSIIPASQNAIIASLCGLNSVCVFCCLCVWEGGGWLLQQVRHPDLRAAFAQSFSRWFLQTKQRRDLTAKRAGSAVKHLLEVPELKPGKASAKANKLSKAEQAHTTHIYSLLTDALATALGEVVNVCVCVYVHRVLGR